MEIKALYLTGECTERMGICETNMSYANHFKDNERPYVMCIQPPCACASGTWVGVKSHTCEDAIN